MSRSRWLFGALALLVAVSIAVVLGLNDLAHEELTERIEKAESELGKLAESMDFLEEANRPTLAATLDASDPDGKLMLGTTANEDEVIGVFRLTADRQDMEVRKVLFGISNGDRVASYRLLLNGVEVATAPSGASPEFVLKDGGTIPQASSARLELRADLRNITLTSEQDKAVRATLQAVQARSVSDESPVSVAFLKGTPTGNAHYVFEAYPSFSAKSTSPSGYLVPSEGDLLAVIAVAAKGNKDITFGPGDVFTVRVAQAVNDHDGDAEQWVLRDLAGTTLARTTADTAAASQVRFRFENELTVPAANTKELHVFADTTELEDDGDAIQLWLDADLEPGMFTWGIDGHGGRYEHPDIVFRGNILADAQVNPS